MSMTPEELSRLRELCQKASESYANLDDFPTNSMDWDFVVAARPALPRLLDEIERLENFHEELNNLRLNVENMAGQADDQWRASGLDALGTMLRMWFLEEGQERKQTIRRQATALNEANQLLDQTVEVLRDINTGWFAPADYAAWDWWEERAKPLLDNLKALKKEME